MNLQIFRKVLLAHLFSAVLCGVNMPEDRYQITLGHRGAKYSWSRNNLRLSTNNLLYLKHGTGQTDSFYKKWLGSRLRPIDHDVADDLGWP